MNDAICDGLSMRLERKLGTGGARAPALGSSAPVAAPVDAPVEPAAAACLLRCGANGGPRHAGRWSG